MGKAIRSLSANVDSMHEIKEQKRAKMKKTQFSAYTWKKQIEGKKI